jgi:HPt (histidine-containing phosphotransfer) domain-containing protein
MNELIALYLAELPALRNELDRMASANDVDGARLLAHRLRGSGGSYGFPQISAAAAELDALARTASSGADWINACRELTAILRRVALRRTASVV